MDKESRRDGLLFSGVKVLDDPKIPGAGEHLILDLCYTLPMMSTDQPTWSAWARFLRRWGLQEVIASLLEAAGPLNLLLAQLVYLGKPLLAQSLQPDALDVLAQMLEEPACRQNFVNLLRETSRGESGA